MIAVLINGISKSGLGGGLGVMSVPIMALVIAPRQAAAILLPILIAMDFTGLIYYRRKFDWPNLKILLPFSILGIGMGWWAFGRLQDAYILIVVGTIAFVFTLNLFTKKTDTTRGPSIFRGGFWGTVAGFASTLIHAGGPPIHIYLLPQKLDKSILIGTMVVLFTVINLVKLFPYYFLGQLNSDNLLTSLVLAPCAPLGIWFGVKIHAVVNEKWFYGICYFFLLVTGCKLLWQGVSELVN